MVGVKVGAAMRGLGVLVGARVGMGWAMDVAREMEGAATDGRVTGVAREVEVDAKGVAKEMDGRVLNVAGEAIGESGGSVLLVCGWRRGELREQQ